MNRRWAAALAVLAAAGILAWLFRAQLADLNKGELTSVIYLGLWLVLIAGGVAASRTGLGPHWLRNAALWALILLGAMGAYTFKDDLSALLHPSAPRERGGVIELRRAEDGHFWADVEINGVPLRMMIDTGASTIALTPRDARKLGLDPAALAYTIPVSTAQGESMAAPLTLDQVRVGDISLDRVTGAVMREDSAASLLGMSFLDRVDSYEVRRDSLTLRR